MKRFFSLHFCFLCVADFVPMEGVADFPVDIHNFLAAPGIPDCPPIYEPLQSPVDSDLSCPPSPSPVSSPSPNSSSSSSESGIEDVSDMEESTSFLAANGSLLVKMENPSSPLNCVNLPVLKRRAIKRRFKKENDSSVLEELNKLLVETSLYLSHARLKLNLPVKGAFRLQLYQPLILALLLLRLTKPQLHLNLFNCHFPVRQQPPLLCLHLAPHLLLSLSLE